MVSSTFRELTIKLGKVQKMKKLYIVLIAIALLGIFTLFPSWYKYGVFSSRSVSADIEFQDSSAQFNDVGSILAYSLDSTENAFGIWGDSSHVSLLEVNYVCELDCELGDGVVHTIVTSNFNFPNESPLFVQVQHVLVRENNKISSLTVNNNRRGNRTLRVSDLACNLIDTSFLQSDHKIVFNTALQIAEDTVDGEKFQISLKWSSCTLNSNEWLIAVDDTSNQYNYKYNSNNDTLIEVFPEQ